MEMTKQEKLKLIHYFEFALQLETSKPVDEMDGELIKAYVDVLLDLQDMHVELSPEFIDEQVRKIFHPEDAETTEPETVKEPKKVVSKKKIWLVAACIAILVALFSVASIAFEWNIFDELKNRFGTVADTPIEVEQELNGISVIQGGNNTNYRTIEDALQTEKINVLYPTFLPNDIKVTDIIFYQREYADSMAYMFNDTYVSSLVTFNSGINEEIKSFSNEILTINGWECYICEMNDVSCVQIYFEYKGNLYMFGYTNKEDAIKIVENLKESNYDD